VWHSYYPRESAGLKQPAPSGFRSWKLLRPEDSQLNRLLVFSPHLDDAVLSFGANIAQTIIDGGAVSVFTVFAGIPGPPYSPAALRYHATWKLPDGVAVACRRKEDALALTELGATYRHGEHLDAIYRRTPEGEWVVGSEAVSVSRQRIIEEDRGLLAAVASSVAEMIEKFRPTDVLTCAAIGNHIDHRLTRDSVLLAAREHAVPVRLWQDLPYAEHRLDTAALPSGTILERPIAEGVGLDAERRKFAAIGHYGSQLPILNRADKDVYAQLREHARETIGSEEYAELTWAVNMGAPKGRY
jgi:LmbE family N-acetylglucosaminyl deacetylase